MLTMATFVSNGNDTTAVRRLQFRALCCYDVGRRPPDKLPLETEPAAQNKNMILTLKPGHQTCVAPYSTDNRSPSQTK